MIKLITGFLIAYLIGAVIICSVNELAAQNQPARIKLNAACTEGIVTLCWQVNKCYRDFEIERSEANHPFCPLGQLLSTKGQDTLGYVFEDGTARTGSVYYRIKIRDWNGDSSYSGISIVQVDRVDLYSIWPIPFTKELWFQSDFSDDAVVTYSLYGQKGKLIQGGPLVVIQGEFKTRIPIPENLLTGQYFLIISDAQGQEIKSCNLIRE